MSKLQVRPSPLGFLQLRNPFAFPLQCEPDVEFLTLKGRSHSRDPSAPGEGAYQKEQLATQPRPLSPAPLTHTSQALPWHPLHLPSPPTGNDIGNAKAACWVPAIVSTQEGVVMCSSHSETIYFKRVIMSIPGKEGQAAVST